MNKELSFNDYQKQALSFATYNKEYALLYPALALQEEVGEVSGKLAKLYRDNNGIMPEGFVDTIKKELGDVMWNIAALANYFMLDLEDIASSNISKLQSRKERNVLNGSGDNR